MLPTESAPSPPRVDAAEAARIKAWERDYVASLRAEAVGSDSSGDDAAT